MPNISDAILWLLQGGSGAVAGYLTNKYAVNMLFKEYTPFKIGKKVLIPYKMGGVIKNSKEQFIDEISSLVERDIINGKTLKNEISKQSFKKEIENLSSVFFNESLSEAFSDTKFSEINCFEDTIKNIKTFTKENIKDVSYDFTYNLVSKININDILSSEQINNISNVIYKELLNEISSDNIIANLMNDLYEEKSQMTLNDILNNDTKENILNNITKNINSIIMSLLDNDEKINEILNKIYEICDIDHIINKFQLSLKEKELCEFISTDECSIIAEKLFDNINIYIKSENGRQLTEKYASQLIAIVESMDFTIYDLLPEEIGHKLSDVIKENLPKFIPYVSEWITKNKDEFDTLIEEAIDEALAGMDEGIKSLVISKVRSLFMQDISAKNKIIEKVVNYIENYEVSDLSSEELSNKIIDYLKNTKIKDIITALKDKNILNEDLINKIGNVIGNIFSKYGKNIIEKLLVSQLNAKIGTFIKYDFVKLFDNYGKDKILNYVLKCREKLSLIICDFINKKITLSYNTFCKKKLNSIISKEEAIQFTVNSSESIISLISENKNNIINALNNEIYSVSTSINLKEYLENNKLNIQDNLADMVLKFEESVIEKYKDMKISWFISNIKNKDDIAKYTSDEICGYLNKNLEDILNNNVKKVIYDNLMEFNEEEIGDLAQKFMGNELKPLSIFGGILGLIVGCIFGLFINNLKFNGFYGSFSGTILSMITMGAIGVVTNVIAITMLFKPYKKNKFLAKIPFLKYFALGYIPAHKDNLSRSIGNVIDNELLNSEKIKLLLNANKASAQKNIINTIEKSNYKVLVNFINNKKDKISLNIYKFIRNKFIENKSFIDNSIGKIKLKSLIKNIDIDDICSKLNNNITLIEDKLTSCIENKLNSNLSLGELIPHKIISNVQSSIENEISAFLNENYNKLLNEENIKSFILRNNNVYREITNKSLLEILGDETSENIKSYSKDKITEFIFNDMRFIIDSKIKELLSKELDGDKAIKDAFNGNITIFINENMKSFGDFVINKICDILLNQEDNISSIVKSKVNESLNFFEKIGYAMAGGDNIVDNCVSILISKKIPDFLDVKFDEINIIIKESLNNNIYPMKISDLKLKSSEMNTGAVLNNIFEMLQRNDALKFEIINGTDLFIDLALNTKLNSILDYINLKNIKDVYNVFENEITIIRTGLLNNLNSNNSTMTEYMHNIVQENMLKEILKIKLSSLMYNIEDSDIRYISNNLVSILNESTSVKSALSNLISSIYEKLTQKEIREIVDFEQFKDNIFEIIKEVFSHNDFNDINISLVSKLLNKCIKDEFNFINFETKHDISEKTSEALINASINKCSNILNSIDLKYVTSYQIEIMDAKEIHDLFNSFAGRYFTKLYLYGAYGALFGINVWLPIIWIPIDMMMEQKQSSEEILENN